MLVRTPNAETAEMIEAGTFRLMQLSRSRCLPPCVSKAPPAHRDTPHRQPDGVDACEEL